LASDILAEIGACHRRELAYYVESGR
jgi:hypothetical protein